MPSDPELKELHRELLTLLKKFHEICVSNGILYSLHGGTLLGAVRENGFIPWDDDIDVSLTRSEYEKLEDVMKKDGDMYDLQLIHIDRLIRMVPKEGNQVLYLDLFIYDYVSENRLAQKCKVYGIMFLGSLLKTKEGFRESKPKINVVYSRKKYLMVYCIYLFGKLFPTSWKLAWFRWFCKNCFCGEKKQVLRTDDQYVGLLLPLPVEVTYDYQMIPFEDTELMVSTKYHDVLFSCYGADYMMPRKPESWEMEVHRRTRENLFKYRSRYHL